ncbi:MAG: MATE family efflux transporter [Ruminococcaceae bacterium]|nr:MATE family efflux transporter [Oscillospiraceae bacterium]
MQTAEKKRERIPLKQYLFPGKITIPADSSEKSLYKDIIVIAWPALVELILTQLTSMADLMMVGNLGPWAITSVGLSTQPKFLLMTMFMSLNVGVTALVARLKGEGKPDVANDVFRQAMVLNIVLGVIMCTLGWLFAEPLVLFMGAQEAATLKGGADYLRYQMVGFIPLALTTTMTAAMRGAGHSKAAMYYNTSTNVVNIILNYLLIEGRFGFPRLEVVGASLATSLGQCVGFTVALIFSLKGKYYVKLNYRGYRFNFEIIKRIARVGAPAMLEQCFMRAGMIMFAKTVANLGTVEFATHQVCMNIQALSFMTGTAFSTSATSLVGQSLGRKRPELAECYASRSRRIGLITAVLLMILFIACPRPIVAAYNDDPQIVETGARILMMLAFMQPFQSSQLITAGALRGAGDTRFPAIVSFLTVFLLRPGIAMWLVSTPLGLYGAWIAMIGDQLVRTGLIFLRYNSGKWKLMKV